MNWVYTPVLFLDALVRQNLVYWVTKPGCCSPYSTYVQYGRKSVLLFDIYTTGKVNIGKATKQTEKQFVAVVNDTDKPGK